MKNNKKLLVIVITLMFVFSFNVLIMGATDFGGETVTIVSWNQTLDSEFDEGGRAPGLVEEAEEKFNCEIEFISFPHYEYQDQFLSRLMSGDSEYDIWQMQDYMTWNLISQGAVYPIGDVLPEEYWEDLPSVSAEAASTLKYEGSIYAYGNTYWRAVQSFMFTAYNKDLLEEAGAPDVYELYKNGEWTWDKMEEIAKDITADTDGDGETDIWGIGQIWPWEWRNFMLSNDAYGIDWEEQGVPQVNYDNENLRKSLRTLQKWYTEDQIIGGTEEFRATSQETFVEGNVAFFNSPLFMIGDAGNKIRDQETEVNWGVVPLPMGPDIEDYRYPIRGLVNWILPTNSADSEGLVELTQFLWPNDYHEKAMEELFTTGKYPLPDKESFNVVIEGLKDWSQPAVPIVRFHGIVGLHNDRFQEIMSGEAGIAETLDAAAPPLQAEYEDRFGE